MKSPIDPLFGIPEWLLAVLFVVVMVAACEAGYKLGLRSRVQEKTKALVPTVAASILALVGLLLSFTMSMSVGRYDVRRRLLVEEANALGTVYLRMQALPTSDSSELEELLRHYVDVRLQVSQRALDLQALSSGREEGARLQNELWSRAAALAQKDPRSVPAGLLLEALNNAFDLENARWISFVAHVPESVIAVDSVMGLVAALLVGYGFGTTGHRHLLSEGLLIFSIVVVMALIVDLDHPHSGVVRISQQPLIDLHNHLAAPSR